MTFSPNTSCCISAHADSHANAGYYNLQHVAEAHARGLNLLFAMAKLPARKASEAFNLTERQAEALLAALGIADQSVNHDPSTVKLLKPGGGYANVFLASCPSSSAAKGEVFGSGLTRRLAHLACKLHEAAIAAINTPPPALLPEHSHSYPLATPSPAAHAGNGAKISRAIQRVEQECRAISDQDAAALAENERLKLALAARLNELDGVKESVVLAGKLGDARRARELESLRLAGEHIELSLMAVKVEQRKSEQKVKSIKAQVEAARLAWDQRQQQVFLGKLEPVSARTRNQLRQPTASISHKVSGAAPARTRKATPAPAHTDPAPILASATREPPIPARSVSTAAILTRSASTTAIPTRLSPAPTRAASATSLPSTYGPIVIGTAGQTIRWQPIRVVRGQAELEKVKEQFQLRREKSGGGFDVNQLPKLRAKALAKARLEK